MRKDEGVAGDLREHGPSRSPSGRGHGEDDAAPGRHPGRRHQLRAVVERFARDEPHPVRGPFTRWPRVSDAVLAAAVFGLSLVTVAASAVGDEEELTLTAVRDLPTGAISLLGVAAAALVVRRRRPGLATATSLVVLLVWAALEYGDGQELALVVAVYSVGRYVEDPVTSAVWVASALVADVVGMLIDGQQRLDLVPAAVITLGPWYVGRRVRDRHAYLALLRERAVRIEAEQQARARQAVTDERARIARELHDVVAHRVSMMTVQAGAAKTIARHDLDTAVEAMGDVERAGRQALGELRHLLGVLRPTAGADALGPQPGLADLGALVDEVATTGADIGLSIDDLPTDLPAAVDLSGHRIVQEALTNVVKHAGPRPTVRIAITVDDGWLDIDVVNSVDGSARGLPGTGFGLVGMRERCHLLGGSLQAGPCPTGEFGVHARLPIDRPAP